MRYLLRQYQITMTRIIRLKCSCGDQEQQQMGACYYTKPILSQLPAR